MDTGFLDLQIESVTSTRTDAPSASDHALALELHGFAILLIPMRVMDACPTVGFDANWVMVRAEPERTATAPRREWFGTFASAHGPNPATSLPSRHDLTGLEPLQSPRAFSARGCRVGDIPIYGGQSRILRGGCPVIQLARAGADCHGIGRWLSGGLLRRCSRMSSSTIASIAAFVSGPLVG